MPRKGIRPHTWKVQGELNHSQYLVFLQMRAQANYRGEKFSLTFEEFQSLWAEHWHLKGRSSDDYCLTREDPDGDWVLANVKCIPRVEHLRRQRRYKKERSNGKHSERA